MWFELVPTGPNGSEPVWLGTAPGAVDHPELGKRGVLAGNWLVLAGIGWDRLGLGEGDHRLSQAGRQAIPGYRSLTGKKLCG